MEEKEGAPWEERVVECPVHKENEQGREKRRQKRWKEGKKSCGD